MSSGNDKRKRKASAWQQKKNWRLKNPRRGPPGILLTCETGREFKCRREGLEILEYYWKRLYEKDGNEKKKKEHDQEEERQSLDEELAALKQSSRKSARAESSSSFVEFETGCRGSVFLLSKEAKECSLKQSDKMDDTNVGEPGASNPAKRQRCEESTEATDGQKDPQEASKTTEKKLEYKPSWEPLELVKNILEDVGKEHDSSIPASRFVTRIIPIQVTCFTSETEMKINVERLLKSILESTAGKEESNDKTPPTFAIQSKRRNCGHITRDQLIDWVASQVGQTTREFGKTGEWKVNLKSPDYTVWIEICKTLCGISIVPSKYLAIAPNFNIAELRDKKLQEE